MRIKLPPKKEQLLSEHEFISYCTRNEADTYVKSPVLDIDVQFLLAAQKDSLIKPLLEIEEKTKDKEGVETLTKQRYYSPHQIYMVAELRRNKVNKDGYLADEAGVGWLYGAGEPEKLRMIAWGENGWVNPTSLGSEFGDDWLSITSLEEKLHNFLGLLHGLELKPEFETNEEKRRLWRRAPSLDYDLTPIKKGGENLLVTYGLSLDNLNKLRKSVGISAQIIDPLGERWYYYIKRHALWRKDMFKGDAALAQKIYHIYDLITEVVEAVTTKKQLPLIELLHKDGIGSNFLMPMIEYVSGLDVKALQYSIKEFKEWMLKEENKPFVTEKLLQDINSIGDKLALYESRYGARSYSGNTRNYNDEDVKFRNNGDAWLEKFIENIRKQDTEMPLGEIVSFGIERELDELGRELRNALWVVGNQFRKNENEAWEKERRFESWFWSENHEELNKLNRSDQIKWAKEEHRKISDEAKYWKERAREFSQKAERFIDLVFCDVCRKRPVQLHIENREWRGGKTVICDDCLKNHKLREMPQGEWRCNNCGNQILSKFAYNNLLSDLTVGGKSELRVELEYGKLKIEAECKKCGQKYSKTEEWGWQP